ncbi:MAG: hypothetical protein HC828_07560 [Blastochloris sp.]|nr:hypothetical protein [Blastochloris sp.]
MATMAAYLKYPQWKTIWTRFYPAAFALLLALLIGALLLRTPPTTLVYMVAGFAPDLGVTITVYWALLVLWTLIRIVLALRV